MAIINRDLSHSQARFLPAATITGTPSGISAGVMNPGVNTSATFTIANVNCPSLLKGIFESPLGVSGSPVHSVWIARFVVGSGITTINIGGSLVVTDFGTSGINSYTLAQGTTFQLANGDVLFLQTSGSNAAVATSVINVVIQAIQDIRQDFGI